MTSLTLGQPLSHQFKTWMEEKQLMDGFSVYHAGIGGVKAVINRTYYAYNERYAWHEEPSSWVQVKRNFYLAMLWEIGEFGVEGKWDYDYYMDFYGGNFWYNNLMDVFLDCAVFSIPHYKGIYYDFKIWRNNLRVGILIQL